MAYYARRYYVGEKDIKMLELLAEGLTSNEIGKILNLSGRTVEKNIYDMEVQLDAKNRVELISIAYQKGHLKIKEDKRDEGTYSNT